MQTMKRFSTVFFAAMLATLVGCAGGETSKSTGQMIDDASVTTRVKTALIRSDQVDANDVNVETYKGTVQLNGFVDSRSEASAAESVAMQVEGVNDVQNNLRVKGNRR